MTLNYLLPSESFSGKLSPLILNHQPMNAVVATSDPNYGKFIQKSLLYENINTTVVSFQEMNAMAYSMNSDVFLFYIPEPIEEYKIYVNRLASVRKDCLIILLTDSSVSQIKYPWIISSFDLIFSKPFSFLNIAFEIKRTLMERRNRIVGKKLNGGNVVLDLSRREVFFKNNKIALRNKEFSLLQYLMMNQNKVITRPEILEHVWDYNSNILTNTVDVHISRLRKKLKTYSAGDIIRTIPCIGYIYENADEHPAARPQGI